MDYLVLAYYCCSAVYMHIYMHPDRAHYCCAAVYIHTYRTCILTRHTSIGQEQKEAIPPETAPIRMRKSTNCVAFMPVLSGWPETTQGLKHVLATSEKVLGKFREKKETTAVPTPETVRGVLHKNVKLQHQRRVWRYLEP